MVLLLLNVCSTNTVLIINNGIQIMSFWFPTDYGDNYQRKSLWLRAGALCCSSLGLILLVTRHTHPFTLLVWQTARCVSYDDREKLIEIDLI